MTWTGLFSFMKYQLNGTTESLYCESCLDPLSFSSKMFMVVGTLRVPSILCSKVYGTRSVPTTMHCLN